MANRIFPIRDCTLLESDNGRTCFHCKNLQQAETESEWCLVNCVPGEDIHENICDMFVPWPVTLETVGNVREQIQGRPFRRITLEEARMDAARLNLNLV